MGPSAAVPDAPCCSACCDRELRPRARALTRPHIPPTQLADVLLYLVRLADACGIDLGAAALDKAREGPPGP